MRAWLPAFALFLLFAALGTNPPAVQRAKAWLAYRLAGAVPPPLVVGRNGRLFLGNHSGSPPNSLIEAVCGNTVSDATVRHGRRRRRPGARRWARDRAAVPLPDRADPAAHLSGGCPARHRVRPLRG